MKENHFYFGEVDRLNTLDDYVVELPEEIATPDQLLQAYDDLLHFPEYFGFNWNAMDECLRDLEWIQNRRIIIIHKSLPKIERSQVRIYLSILSDCMREWEKNGAHVVIVAFPEQIEQYVNSLLQRSSDGV
jgi:hypothetical protein